MEKRKHGQDLALEEGLLHVSKCCVVMFELFGHMLLSYENNEHMNVILLQCFNILCTLSGRRMHINNDAFQPPAYILRHFVAKYPPSFPMSLSMWDVSSVVVPRITNQAFSSNASPGSMHRITCLQNRCIESSIYRVLETFQIEQFLP